MAWTCGICSGHVHPLVLLRNLCLLLKTGFIPEKGSIMTNCSLLVTTVFRWLCIGCQLVHERSGSLCSEPAASWERTACWLSSWYPTCGLVGSDRACTKPEPVLQAGSSGTHMDQGARREEGGAVAALKLGLKNARNCSGSKIRIKWPTQNEAPLGAGAVGAFEVGPLQKAPLLSMGTSFTAFSLVQRDRMISGCQCLGNMLNIWDQGLGSWGLDVQPSWLRAARCPLQEPFSRVQSWMQLGSVLSGRATAAESYHAGGWISSKNGLFVGGEPPSRVCWLGIGAWKRCRRQVSGELTGGKRLH